MPIEPQVRELVRSVQIAGQQSWVREVTVVMADGDRSVMQHLYIDRIDFCAFGNSAPFRIRIVNAFNDNPDQRYFASAHGDNNLQPGQLDLIGAVSIVFVVMRLAFWIGYRIRPIYRAFGFAGTAYLNLGLLAASLWLSVT